MERPLAESIEKLCGAMSRREAIPAFRLFMEELKEQKRDLRPENLEVIVPVAIFLLQAYDVPYEKTRLFVTELVAFVDNALMFGILGLSSNAPDEDDSVFLASVSRAFVASDFGILEPRRG